MTTNKYSPPESPGGEKGYQGRLKNGVFVFFAAVFVMLSVSCRPVEEAPGLEPVKGFELERYLGTWYEIARMPIWFERNLVNVTATYTLLPDGSVQVLNQGFVRTPDGKKKQATARAVFAKSPDVGHLMVSFFWPFSSDYIIAELDKEHYGYALIRGKSDKYMWILSRTPRMEEDTIKELVRIAQGLGFDTTRLIFTQQQW